MRARSWLPLLIAAVVAPTLLAGPASGHGRNDLNRNHPGRVDARTGNFRRADVVRVTRADQAAWVRPLARALAFSAKDQTKVLDRVAAYRNRGEEIALVALHNGTGVVKVVAIPHDLKRAPRVMGDKEVRKLGISPQGDVVPSLLSRIRGKDLGPVPAKAVRKASLSTSGLSYQGVGTTPAQWPARSRPLRPDERAVTQTYLTLPVTARKGNLSGASIMGWVTIEKIKK